MYWTNTTVVTVWNGCTPRWWLYVLDGHQSGDSMYLIDTTLVTLCIGWTTQCWMYVLDGHHSGDCKYWIITTAVTLCIWWTPQCTVCIGWSPQCTVCMDGHHSGDCMYWMVTTVVTVCIVLTTAVAVNSYHSKSCQPPQWTYSYKAITEQTLNLWKKIVQFPPKSNEFVKSVKKGHFNKLRSTCDVFNTIQSLHCLTKQWPLLIYPIHIHTHALVVGSLAILTDVSGRWGF